MGHPVVYLTSILYTVTITQSGNCTWPWGNSLQNIETNTATINTSTKQKMLQNNGLMFFILKI